MTRADFGEHSRAALSERAASALLRRIERAVEAAGRPVRLMEVCGTHTVAIYRSGIHSVLPAGLSLVSGPGCPVCVTPSSYMDRAIAIARLSDVTVATYGDMMRVPGTPGSGTSASLVDERARGADVRIVYSSTDALELARDLPERRVVFLAVGFETTSPGIAATALAAEREAVTNFHMLASPKLIPPALDAVLALSADRQAVSAGGQAMSAPRQAGGARLDGFLCPGHVSVITGSKAYEQVARGRGVACVVAGFEPSEILLGLAMAAEQVARSRAEGPGRAEVEIAYRHAVTREGNARARAVMDEVFETVDTGWRGLGTIPKSGLALRERFRSMDAALHFDVDVPGSRRPGEPPGCRCGEVLAGLATPEECGMFGEACTPESPVGPCMVSSEGTCAAHFKYGEYGLPRGGRQ